MSLDPFNDTFSLFIVNDTFESVFDSAEAEESEDALVNQVYDEIGLEFSESVKLFKIIPLYV